MSDLWEADAREVFAGLLVGVVLDGPAIGVEVGVEPDVGEDVGEDVGADVGAPTGQMACSKCCVYAAHLSVSSKSESVAVHENDKGFRTFILPPVHPDIRRLWEEPSNHL